MADEQNLIKIQLPVELFGEGARVERKARVPLRDVRNLSVNAALESLERLALVYPNWHGVCDVETGEALPNPSDDAVAAFEGLEMKQLVWFFNGGLTHVPNGVK